MVELQRVSRSDAPSARLGTLPEEREPIAWRRLRGVIAQDLDARVQDVFADFDEKPFAIASIGQVHRAHTQDGEHVAVKVQHPDIADSIARDVRNIGLVTPILKRLAPGSDAGALLSEVRERIRAALGGRPGGGWRGLPMRAGSSNNFSDPRAQRARTGVQS